MVDTANISFPTNGTMVQSFVLTQWADLLDLSSGKFHMQMRVGVGDAVVDYEWSTDNGNIAYSQTKANGFIVFTENPGIGSSITLGTSTVAFVTSAPVGNQVMIRDTLAHTLSDLRAFLQASVDPQISQCDYAIGSASTLIVTFNTAGTLGNLFAIDTTVGGSTASGLMLSGAGGMAVISAPVEHIENFSGDYVYDLRWEFDDTLLVPLLGGIITFVQGVTRDNQHE